MMQEIGVGTAVSVEVVRAGSQLDYVLMGLLIIFFIALTLPIYALAKRWQLKKRLQHF